MTISLNTLRSNIFTDVYAVINSNVSDPLTRGKQWIFSTMPNTDAPNFIGFPLIVISKGRVMKEFDVFDNDYSDKRTPIIITIYSTSNAQLDSLSDSVDAVMTPSNFPQFNFYDYSESDSTTDLGGGKVYFRTMTHFVILEDLS